MGFECIALLYTAFTVLIPHHQIQRFIGEAATDAEHNYQGDPRDGLSHCRARGRDACAGSAQSAQALGVHLPLPEAAGLVDEGPHFEDRFLRLVGA